MNSASTKVSGFSVARQQIAMEEPSNTLSTTMMERPIDRFLNRYGHYNLANYPICSQPLEWAGYGGGSPSSGKVLELLECGHYMAAAVIVPALVESMVRNLFWAVLADAGVDAARANEIADGRLRRTDMIGMINSLSTIKVRDIFFPERNLIAHGIWFDKKDSFHKAVKPDIAYRSEILDQVSKIKSWTRDIANQATLTNIMPSETERWILFGKHWSKWLSDQAMEK